MVKLLLAVLVAAAAIAIGWIAKQENSALLSQKTEYLPTLVAPLPADNANSSASIFDLFQTAQQSTAETVAITLCNKNCEHTLELIRSPFELSGQEYEAALLKVDSLAPQLRDSQDIRSELIDLAVHTTGNRRKIIIAAFKLLDNEDQLLLGSVLLSESPFKQQRLDGIQLLASPEVMAKPLLQTFSEVLQVEQDEYVRSAAVKALNQPKIFYGDQEVLDVLSDVIYSDTDDNVRGEALIASVRLTENPEALFNFSMEAIRSGAGKYQHFGVRALEEIIDRQTKGDLVLSWQNDSEVRKLMEELNNPEYDEMPAEARKALEELYRRYF